MTLNLNSKSEEGTMKRVKSIRLVIAVLAFCLPWIPNPASAQQEKGKESTTAEHKPVAAYRIELNVREVEDGKRLNSRNYLMVIKDDDWTRMRVGNKVPYQTSSTQYQYTDVGMSVDCRPLDLGDSVGLTIRVEFSGLAPAPQTQTASAVGPVFRTDRADIESVVTLGKPTLVASMEDTFSNRRYEIEVTATKVK
jgi:hypothetical protein